MFVFLCTRNQSVMHGPSRKSYDTRRPLQCTFI